MCLAAWPAGSRPGSWGRQALRGGAGTGSWEGAGPPRHPRAPPARPRRAGEAARLLDEARPPAATVGATSLADAPDQLAGLFDGGSATPWFPLSRREFEVAKLVAAGLTNRQIAEQLVRAVPVRARCRCARRARRCAVAGALRPGTALLLGALWLVK